MGLPLWLVWLLNFLFPTFFSISSIWALIFLSLPLFFFWGQVFCSFTVPDELTLFVAAFNFGAFIHNPNIDMHSAQNGVKFMFWPCVFNKLCAIPAKYGSCNCEANCVLSASLASSFQLFLILITFWPKIWSSSTNWSSVSQGHCTWL